MVLFCRPAHAANRSARTVWAAYCDKLTSVTVIKPPHVQTKRLKPRSWLFSRSFAASK